MNNFDLVEQSFEIAWGVLERSGELSDPRRASQFLVDEIIEMVHGGQRHRLILSNRAIEAYRRKYLGLRLVSVSVSVS